eukprot:6502422-Lingulodinium_polyedra.AAC.1
MVCPLHSSRPVQPVSNTEMFRQNQTNKTANKMICPLPLEVRSEPDQRQTRVRSESDQSQIR